MNAQEHEPLPSYVAVDDGKIRANQSGVELTKRYNELHKQYRQLDVAYVGAVLASLFLSRPWLSQVTLELNASVEHDDSGGSYRSVYSTASGVQVVPGAEIPDDLQIEGEADENAMEEDVRQALEDSETEMYAALTNEGCDEDLTFVVQRAAIADLLQAHEVDGRAAFLRLLPEFKLMLGEH